MNKTKPKKYKYGRLKASLMIRTILSYFIAGGVGYVLIYQVFFDKIRHHKILLLIYFILLFIILFYTALSSMTKYLDEVVDGIDNVLEQRYESIVLIDELEPLEQKLNELKDQLDKQELELKTAEGKKNDLILYLAHDLKTPLTSIIAYLNMIETHPNMDDETRRKYTHVAYEKALRMHQLTQEFFEITQFHLQGIKLEKQEFRLDVMLEQISDELYGVLQTKNMSCEFESEGDLLIHADPNKIARVFDNLLRNAIAYSFPETIIKIHATSIRDFVRITFTNRGPTIPAAALENLFDKFYRADNSRNSKTGGAGLGLAIAKAIVDSHGGNIIAESDNNIIRFTVDIPKDEIK